MALMGPKALTERTWKRKASDPDDENPNLVLDSETLGSSKAELQTKKKKPPSPHYDYTSLSDAESDTEFSCSGSSISSDESRNSNPDNQWDNRDLEYLNIFFEKTPETLENFTKEVKDGYRNREGVCPNPSRMTDILRRQLEEDLTFSYDLGEVRDIRCASAKDVIEAREEVSRKIKENVQRMQDKAEDFDSENQLCRVLESAVGKSALEVAVLFNSASRHFARETELLLKLVLREPLSSSKQNEAGPGKNYFLNFCKVFGKIFFLSEGELPLVSFTLNDCTLRKKPGIVYPWYSLARGEELLFITEVHEAPVNEDTADIKDQVGTKIMGQFGIELIGQLRRSVFYPNCLGVLCMETKLIFVLLKVSKKHAISLCKGQRGSAEIPGKIMYTEPLDMLKAEDRLKMAEFFFWLGCLQDPKKHRFC
ncbi:uncharacterized protein LOC134278745 isoform X2 [Saccostrea cucullata]|uniref:uncharacterized protein LOC134278745 isoform X2 n=1 Tax=Saccostrea cuccullata TaxID=36930 RepID=UPI002ED2ED83